jgi:hypothetical protein
VGLPDAENFAGLYLCEAATLDDAVDVQSEMGLELLAFGIGESFENLPSFGKPGRSLNSARPAPEIRSRCLLSLPNKAG